MDFSIVKTEAADFLSKTNNALTFKRFDDVNYQIHLSTTDGKIVFYILCPSTDSPSWSIWSDCEESQKVLQYVIDSCNLDNCSNVSAVLQSVADKLQFATKMKSYKNESSDTLDQNDEDSALDEDGDDANFDDYYVEEDCDTQKDEETIKRIKEEEEEINLSSNFSDHPGSEMAVRRLIKDLKAIRKDGLKYGIVAEPKGNNLFSWEVKLVDIPVDSKLGMDLAKYATRYKTEAAIHLNMHFPQDYPFSPPFVRVVKPRFKFLTGHVTIGGSICMQMLTKSGWQPTNDIESILVQVRAEIMSDPKASLDVSRPDMEYSEDEAKVAFQRMVTRYGW